MAKNTQYTESWFIDRGYSFNESTGTWSPPIITKGFIGQKNGFKQQNKLAPADNVGTIKEYFTINDSVSISLPQHSVLAIDGLVAGLNGSKGLMRGHWSNNKKQKEIYQKIIALQLRENKIRQHVGEVTVEYIGYKSRFMDWDNFCASFKNLGDSLVKMKIISDDSPRIITQFIPSQIKVKQIDQKVVIIIKDV